MGTDGYPQVRKTILFVSTHGFNVNLFHSLNSFGHFLSSSAIDHKIKFTNYIYYSQMHTNLLVFKNNSQFQSRGHKLNFMSWSTFLKISWSSHLLTFYPLKYFWNFLKIFQLLTAPHTIINSTRDQTEQKYTYELQQNKTNN